jgi:hypothetical protein
MLRLVLLLVLSSERQCFSPIGGNDSQSGEKTIDNEARAQLATHQVNARSQCTVTVQALRASRCVTKHIIDVKTLRAYARVPLQ